MDSRYEAVGGQLVVRRIARAAHENCIAVGGKVYRGHGAERLPFGERGERTLYTRTRLRKVGW